MTQSAISIFHGNYLDEEYEGNRQHGSSKKGGPPYRKQDRTQWSRKETKEELQKQSEEQWQERIEQTKQKREERLEKRRKWLEDSRPPKRVQKLDEEGRAFGK